MLQTFPLLALSLIVYTVLGLTISDAPLSQSPSGSAARASATANATPTWAKTPGSAAAGDAPAGGKSAESVAHVGPCATPATVPWYDRQAFTILMMSGDIWKIGGGHLFISFSMLLLLLELLRSTRGGRASILNHAFSVMVFIGTLLLFVTVKGYGNSVFFIFMSMTLIDFLAGFIITAVSSQRAVSLTSVSD